MVQAPYLREKAITTVVSGSSVVRDSSGNVTGFKTVNGKYKKHPQFLRRWCTTLYGIKAYDSNPQLCGFSYAYYQGWFNCCSWPTVDFEYMIKNK